MIVNENIEVILANPDRSCPGKPHNFTVSLIHDALLNLCRQLGYNVKSLEIGKPNIDFEEIGLILNEKTIVIGDNPNTDGLLAAKRGFDYVQVGSANLRDEDFINTAVFKVKSLMEFI